VEKRNKLQVKDFSWDQWFVIYDLIVELGKERMHLVESYIQF